MESREIEERARQLDCPLQLRVEGRSFVSYLPFHRQENGELSALLIEDDELCNRLTKLMLEHGVPVTMHVERD